MHPRLLLCLLPFLVACPHGPAPTTGTGTQPGTQEVLAALTLPPRPDTSAALAALARAASEGSCPSAEARARYLLDLFDVVRLLPDLAASDQARLASTHALLWESLSLPGEPARGRLATRLVLEGLHLAATGAAASACRSASAAPQMIELLDADQASRRDPRDALRLAVVYKRLARSDSVFRDNARLRLADWCWQAFKLAAGGEAALQHARLNQCLFALYDADPSPYFEADPHKRPMDPPWTLLRDQLLASLDTLSTGRLAVLGEALKRSAGSFLDQAAPSLPLPLDLGRLSLALATWSQPWDRTPLARIGDKGFLVDGIACLHDQEDCVQRAIARRLEGDRRGRLTLLAPPDSRADEILPFARDARLAGASILELALSRQIADQAPEGDVQRAIFGQGPLFRLETLPFSLLPLAARAAASPSRDTPRGLGYAPENAPNQLSMRIRRDGLILSSLHGTLPVISVKDLAATLLTLRLVYPEDSAMVLVPLPGSLVSDLVSAASTALRHENQSLFPGLALGPSGLPQPEADLSPRLRLLSAAHVTVTPDASRTLAEGLRRCYLRVLGPAVDQKGPHPAGTLLVQVQTGKPPRAVGGTLRTGPLRTCALDQLTRLTSSPSNRYSIVFQIK